MRGIILPVLIVFCSQGWGQISSPGHKYHAFMPPTEDADLKAFFDNPKVEWYTEDEKPKVFQHDFGNPFVSVYKDIGPGGPRFSNGNGEWPWAHPATPTNDGTAKGVIGILKTGVRTFDVKMPIYTIATATNTGRFLGVRQYRTRNGINWKFGEGTDIVELNTNRILQADWTFKVHRMTLDGNEWKFRVYRPITSRGEYEQATGTRATGPTRRRKVDDHMVRAFDETADVFEVPRIDPVLARKILTSTDFKLCTDDDFIPTTRHTGQLYPKNYLGPWIGNATDQDNCRNCHRDVLEEVSQFDLGEWYGHIRGGGHDKHGVGVFSWYPPQASARRQPTRQVRQVQYQPRYQQQCVGAT